MRLVLYKFSLLIIVAGSLISCSDTPKNQLEVAVQGIYGATLSDNGERIVVASINHGGSFWVIPDGERLYNWNHASGGFTELTAVALSGDGQRGLTADGRRIVVWDASTGESIGFWNTPADVLCAALSQQGKIALVGLANYNALVINTETGKILAKLPHNDRVRSVAISDNGEWGLTGSDDHFARFWKLEDGSSAQQWKMNNTVNRVALSGDGKLAFVSSQHYRGDIRDTRLGDVRFTLENRSYSVTAARFSEDNNRILLGNSIREVSVWRIDNKQRLHEWTVPRRSVWKPTGARLVDVAFDRSDNSVVTIASNGMVHEWPMPQ